jgi:hypothetical protein
MTVNCRFFNCFFAAICVLDLCLHVPSLLLAKCDASEMPYFITEESDERSNFLEGHAQIWVDTDGNILSVNAEIAEAEVAWYKGYAAALHKVYRACTYTKEHLRLEDGSSWIVHEDDRSLIEKWLNDVVVIKPHCPLICKSRYQFVIVNQRTNDSVRANVAPYKRDGMGVQRIIAHIDHELGEVYVDDGSVWKIADTQVLAQWDEGHTVILGINDQWFSFYANIIINTQITPVTYIKAYCCR